MAMIVVKFLDGTSLPYYQGDVGPLLDGLGLGTWDDLANAGFVDLELLPLFSSLNENDMDVLLNRAAQGVPSGGQVPELRTYFRIDGVTPGEENDVMTITLSWPGVETSYVDQPAPDPSSVSDDPYSARQGYLNPAPEGIDARYAWRLPGGTGENVNFIDVERGWTLSHEELRELAISRLDGDIVPSSRAHGTAVLGIVCARANGLGVIGVAPGITGVDVVSFVHGNVDNVPATIARAAGELSSGDVLLVEAQGWAGNVAGPTEVDEGDFAAIRTATLAGITVIEVAGNGGVDLDTYEKLVRENGNEEWRRILYRHPDNQDFRDSGAVLVAAASAAVPHKRISTSCHGSRIDCYAWGEGIWTCSSNQEGDDARYNKGAFGYTSGAAAIIAGAAVVIQSLAKRHADGALGPARMRDILSDPLLGTPPASMDVGGIGVMPDLRKIATNEFRIPPVEVEEENASSTTTDARPPVSAARSYPCLVIAGFEECDDVEPDLSSARFLTGLFVGVLCGILLGLFVGMWLTF